MHFLTCDVLPDSNHANDVPLLIPACSGIEEDMKSDTALCDQRELKVAKYSEIQFAMRDE